MKSYNNRVNNGLAQTSAPAGYAESFCVYRKKLLRRRAEVCIFNVYTTTFLAEV
jgi:hypothetical protein